jgi:polar amino acid transport system substrate-binding protein
MRLQFDVALRRVLICALVATTAAVAACGSDSSSSSSGSSGSGGSAAGGGKSAPLAHLLPADIRKSGTLTVATDASYPPCEFFPKPGSPMQGFDVDVWNALGKQLGVQVKAVNTQFDGLIPGVQSGRYPMAMECISDSLDREKQVSFVDFMVDKVGVYTTQSNAGKVTNDPLSVCGLTAAAQSGLDYVGMITNTLSPHCEKNGKPKIKLNQYPKQSDVLLALYSGRVDFVLADLPALAYLRRQAPKPVVLRTNKLLPTLYLGIVVKKDNTQLQKALLAAMKRIMADGTFDAIFKKWDISALKLSRPPGINLAKSDPLPTPKP